MLIATPKDAESVEFFQIDWTGALGADTIAASKWELPNADLAINSQTNSATTATVELANGEPGVTYTIKNVVTLASGEVLVQSLLIPVV